MHQKAENGKHHITNEHHIRSEPFYCVEFSVNEIPFLFQFKIWNPESKPMFILVKQSSDIMPRLNEGDIMTMNYYRSSATYPKKLKTKLNYIRKENHGRFKGHYLVGLKILHCQNR